MSSGPKSQAQHRSLTATTLAVIQQTEPSASLIDTPAQPATEADALAVRILEQVQQGHGQQATGTLEQLGMDIQQQAAHKSQLLAAPLNSLASRAEDGGEVANALIELKLQVEALDPAKYDLSAGWFSRLVGRLPFVGTPLKRYFSRYEAASEVIAAIVSSLESGQKQLQRDNITLIADQKDMKSTASALEQQIAFGRQLDARLEHALLPGASSEEDAGYIRDQLLFPLRQRIQDLQQQLAVAQQGVLTMEVIIRNNQELIRGVDRARQVTVSALQVAVTLALSLAHQKVVLDKIDAINATTNTLIGHTARQLREQGARIQAQAVTSQLDLTILRGAFDDIHGALDDVSRFRSEALPAMATAIQEMDQLSRTSADRIRSLSEHNGAGNGAAAARS